MKRILASKRTPSHPSSAKAVPYIHKGGGPAGKRAVIELVERGGRVRTFHPGVADGATVTKIVRENVARESRLHTDESRLYIHVGQDFIAHETVTHSHNEYVRGDIHTMSKVPSRFSSAECAASTSIAARSICTAIWPSSISATTIAPR